MYGHFINSTLILIFFSVEVKPDLKVHLWCILLISITVGSFHYTHYVRLMAYV